MKKSIFLPVVAMCVISMYSCEEVIPEQKPEIAVTANIGKTDQFLNLYSFSPTTEWTTDVAFNCKASDNSILGQATITAAPLKRNRITSYTGPLFSGNSAMTLALSSDWLTEYTATW